MLLVPELKRGLCHIEMTFRPDNLPIVGMLVLVLYFTYIGFREARRNDELSAQGREDEILNDMQR